MSAAEARPGNPGTGTDFEARMRQILERQRQAHIKDGPPSAEKRIEWLDRAISLLVGHKDAIAEALREDFGHRSVHATQFTDVAGSIGPLKHAKEGLRGWMKREKRKVTPALLGLFGAKAYIEYQPKGVVGVISPWNFPVQSHLLAACRNFRRRQSRHDQASEFTPRFV